MRPNLPPVDLTDSMTLLRYIERAAVMTHPLTSPLSSLNC